MTGSLQNLPGKRPKQMTAPNKPKTHKEAQTEARAARHQARLEAGRKLFAGDVTFMLSVVGMEHLPEPGVPEVCFAGRSNVGKSTLINALTNRKGLARASNTPGRTQELNFFNLGDRIRLVDLPGYGYAKATKSVVEKWTRLTKQYLRGRADLRRIFLLIDSRHGLKPTDLEIMDMLDEVAVIYQIVLTKSDKLKPGQLHKVVEATQKAIKKRPAAFPYLIATSSEKREGLDLIQAEIVSLALSADQV